jgi:hypothetical protein
MQKLDYKLASWINLWGLGFMVETQLGRGSSRFLQMNRKRRGITNEMLQRKLLQTSSRTNQLKNKFKNQILHEEGENNLRTDWCATACHLRACKFDHLHSLKPETVLCSQVQ